MNAPIRNYRTLPELQSGDTLSRDEFEIRYHAMPGVKKAQLVDGVVFMPSPVSQRNHGRPQLQFVTWIGLYVGGTPGVDGGDGSSVRLDLGNEPQPDVLMYIEPDCGGRVQLDADGYIEGAPDLLVEVSASTASIDLGRKMEAYRRNHVAEHIVHRVYDDAIDWFVFRDGDFVLLEPDPADGILKSPTFPGLWLDAATVFRRDIPAMTAVLFRGLASPEHAAFVARLEAKCAGGQRS